MNIESSLTDDELKTLKHKAFEVLSHARHSLLVKYPFIGSIALRMDLVPVRDIRVRTACTDGNCVYFDIAFLSSLSDEEKVFVLAHEVWHAVLLHLTRRGNRNPDLFNIATDKEVNYLLKEDGFTPPQNLCFPEGNEAGKCAEEIYEMMLKKNKKQQKMPNMSSSGAGTGSSSSSSSSTSSNKNSSKSKSSRNKSSSRNGNNQNNENEDGSMSQDGNRSGKLDGQFDKHIYDGDSQPQPNENPDGGQPGQNGSNDEDGSSSQMSEVTDKYGSVGLDSDFKPSVPKGFADRMRETVIAEAQRVEKMRGNVPSHVKELIKKFTASELDWKELLAQFVTKAYNSGSRTWIPPNRRHIHNGLYLQSRKDSKIKLAIVIDTSGSTCGDRAKFLAELDGLVKSFGSYDIHMICCDADVQDYKLYTQDDNVDFKVDGFEFAGGGGTSMLPALNYIIDNQLEVDAVVVLTDGFIDSIPKNPTGLPTLWIITKDGTEDFNDWGQKVRLKNDDSDL